MSGTAFLRRFDRTRRAYRAVYATPEGKAVLEDILSECRYWRKEYAVHDAGGRLDALALARNLGKMEIAAHMIERLGMSDVEMQLRLKSAGEERRE